jgi:hypothetical protein
MTKVRVMAKVCVRSMVRVSFSTSDRQMLGLRQALNLELGLGLRFGLGKALGLVLG